MASCCGSFEDPKILLRPTTHQIEDLNILNLDVYTIPLWDLALKAHYRINPHHPEYFTDPTQMDDKSRKHMLCDLLASFWGAQRKHNVVQEWNIPKVANKCKDYPKWKYVQDLYTGPFEDSSELIEFKRWTPKKFSNEKYEFRKFIISFLRKTITIKEFSQGLYAFESVLHYLEDLLWHQQTIVDVGNLLFPEDSALQADLANHDNDKWDALMIAAYVWKWIFEEEVIELDDRFDRNCTGGCMLYNVIECGKTKIKQMSKDKNFAFLLAFQENNK